MIVAVQGGYFMDLEGILVIGFVVGVTGLVVGLLLGYAFWGRRLRSP